MFVPLSSPSPFFYLFKGVSLSLYLSCLSLDDAEGCYIAIGFGVKATCVGNGGQGRHNRKEL